LFQGKDLQQQRLSEGSLVLAHLAADVPAVSRQPPVSSADRPAVMREGHLLNSTRTRRRDVDECSILRERTLRRGSRDAAAAVLLNRDIGSSFDQCRTTKR